MTPVIRTLAGTSLQLLKSLSTLPGTTFRNDGESLGVLIGGVQLSVDSLEDLWIVREVFRHGFYDLVGMGNDAHVIDVGANIMIAGLRFASMPEVAKVTGFEPMGPTLAKAARNLELNPDLSKKITLNPVGLGARDATISVEYSASWRGSVSAREGALTNPHILRSPDRRAEQAVIREATQAVAEALKDSPSDNFILKLDCEGAEEEILGNLSASGILTRFSQTVIEFHREDHGIHGLLKQAGFKGLSFRPTGDLHLGIIHAVNTQIPSR
jgi:FkbM family methyltransferase